MTPPYRSHLILGGARSGKSRLAVDLARRLRARAVFVATARAEDDDMRRRIARHRAERPGDWDTVEAPIGLVDACRRAATHADVLVVDCLTVWVSNLLLEGSDDDAVLGAAGELARLMAEARATLILVSNEVGWSVHPPTAIGLRFRDLLGSVNQRVAAAADQVTLMVAGLPLEVKRAGGGHADGIARERAPEAL